VTAQSPKNSTMLDRKRARSVYKRQYPRYEAALDALCREVRLILERQGFAPTIKSRIKDFDHYFEKLGRICKDRATKGPASITDMLGLRIICPFLEDVETIEGLISANFNVVETEQKAAQHSFQQFGYDSIHLLVKLDCNAIATSIPGTRSVCEIQLRTKLQDAWAEVEHELVYKSDITLPNGSIRRKLAALNASLALSDVIFQEIRDYQKEIRQRGRKRRENLQDGIVIPEEVSTLRHAEKRAESALRLEPMPAAMASELEKVMLSALTAHSNGELATAIGFYDRMLGMKLDRNIRSLVYNHRGMAFFALADYPRAIRDFSKAVLYDPESFRNHANRGLTYRVMKKFDRSLGDYDKVLQLDSSRLDGYFGRAQTYYEMRLLTRAIADCEHVLQIESCHRPARELVKCIRREIF